MTGKFDKIFALFLCLQVLLTGATVAFSEDSLPPGLNPQMPVMKINNAMELFNKELYWEASMIFEEVVKENPAYPELGLVRYALGFSYLRLGRAADAEKHLALAAEVVKDRPEVFLALAQARLQQEKYDASRGPLEIYLKRVPADAEAHNVLCKLYMMQEQYAQAEPCLKKAVAQTPDSSELWSQYGMALMANGNNEDAMASLAKARELNPDLGEADMYIGMAAYQSGDLDTARVSFEKLYNEGKADGQILGALGSIYVQKNDIGKGEFYFQKALEKSPDDREILMNLVICKANLGKNESAIALFEESHDKYKDDKEILSLLVSVYVQAEKYSQATALLEDNVKRFPDEPEYLKILAQLYGQGFDTDKTVQTWRLYLEKKPDDAEAVEALARVLKRSGKKEEALAEFEHLIKLDNKNDDAYKQAGALYEELELKEKAVDLYKKMAEVFPNSALPPGRLGLHSEKNGDMEEAETYYEAALQKTDMNERYVYVHLAKIRETQGRMIDAELLYRKGLEALLEHSQQVFEEIMEQSQGSLDLMKLIEISEREKGTEEEMDDARSGIHRTFTARGGEDAELQYFLTLFDRYQANKKVGMFAAKLLQDRGDYDRLISVCEKILKIDVKDSEAHRMMGWSYEKKGNLKEAGKAYRRAVEADKNSEQAWRALSDNYLKQGRKEELIMLAEQKHEKSPESEIIKTILNEMKDTSGEQYE